VKKRMIFRSTVGLAFTMVFATLLPAVARAQNAYSKSSTTASCSFNVTSVLNDTDSNNAPFQFQSDGLGPYTTTTSSHGHGTDAVGSMIDKNCAWSLVTTSSTSRGISVTLAYPDGSGSPAPFTGPVVVKGTINTHCPANTANNGIQPGAMTYAGQTLICPINVAFYAPNGVWYNIDLNPYNWSPTTMAQVSCTGASGGQCNTWTVVPDPGSSVVNPTTNQLSSIGELTLPPCVGCGGATPLGLYYFSYSFLIHK
jgi:hypothetical protein